MSELVALIQGVAKAGGKIILVADKKPAKKQKTNKRKKEKS